MRNYVVDETKSRQKTCSKNLLNYGMGNVKDWGIVPFLKVCFHKKTAEVYKVLVATFSHLRKDSTFWARSSD